MPSAWDDLNAGVKVIKVIKPQTHFITSVKVLAPETDSDEPRFGIEFVTERDRTLRVMLPLEVADALAKAMLDLCYSSDIAEVREAAKRLPESPFPFDGKERS
jgi:hypothetical protein